MRPHVSSVCLIRGARHPAHDILAADNQCIVRVYIPRRNLRTLHPIAHSFGVDCIDPKFA